MKRKLFSGGFLFASMINYMELVFITQMLIEDFRCALVISLAALVILYAVALTPLMDFYYRFVLELRLPNEKEAERINTAWDSVTRGAEFQNIKIPEKLQLYVKDDDMENAMAIGKNMIAIHTAMLQQNITDDEISGVLGHELGHIMNGDTISLLMSLQGSLILDGIDRLYKILAWLVEWFFRVIFTIMGWLWWKDNPNKGILLGKIIGFACSLPGKIIELAVAVIRSIETAGYMLFSRKDEFAADKFSVSIGLGNGLKNFLGKISMEETVAKLSLEYILQGTHPPINERIEQIDIWMSQLEKDKKKEEPIVNVMENYSSLLLNNAEGTEAEHLPEDCITKKDKNKSKDMLQDIFDILDE